MRKPPTMTAEREGQLDAPQDLRARRGPCPASDSMTSRSTSLRCPRRWPRGWAGWPAAPWPGRWAGSAAPGRGRSPSTGARPSMTGQEHDHDRVRGHRPADVGEVDAEQLEAAGVADVEAQRQGQRRRRHARRGRTGDVLQEPVGDARASLPVWPSVRNARSASTLTRLSVRARAQGVSRAGAPSSSPSTTKRQHDRPDGAQVDLRVEVGLQALGDELAEAAEAVTRR